MESWKIVKYCVKIKNLQRFIFITLLICFLLLRNNKASQWSKLEFFKGHVCNEICLIKHVVQYFWKFLEDFYIFAKGKKTDILSKFYENSKLISVKVFGITIIWRCQYSLIDEKLYFLGGMNEFNWFCLTLNFVTKHKN